MRRYCLAVVLLVSAARAQTPTAEIAGRVSDASLGIVAGATVTIANLATNAQRVVATNSSGLYDAPALPPGVYSVKVSMTGFKTEVRNTVEVQVNQVARLDFTLEVGNVAETVEVQAEVSTLQTESATVGTVVENRRIV